MVREAGKTLDNALGDVREAVDFLRYYAGEARRLFTQPVSLRGPTGETDTIELRGRGAFACISPWNFPLVTLFQKLPFALAAGCTAVIKPSELTSGTTLEVAALAKEAGMKPRDLAEKLAERYHTTKATLVALNA